MHYCGRIPCNRYRGQQELGFFGFRRIKMGVITVDANESERYGESGAILSTFQEKEQLHPLFYVEIRHVSSLYMGVISLLVAVHTKVCQITSKFFKKILSFCDHWILLHAYYLPWILFRYSSVAHFFKQTLLNNSGHFLIYKCLRCNKSTRYSVQSHCLIFILGCMFKAINISIMNNFTTIQGRRKIPKNNNPFFKRQGHNQFW